MMHRLKTQRGVSLMEALLAVVLFSGVAAIVALTVPSASKAIVSNRHRWVASNLADGKMEDLQKKPYDVLQVTAPGTAGDYFSSITDPGGCDCSSVLWASADLMNATTLAGQPLSDRVVDNDITYTRAVCINYLQRASPGWQSDCSADKGVKSIHVHVSWTFAGNAQSIDLQSVVSRQ